MYECPNCGGNLKFDIAQQLLSCEYCGTQADPYSFYKQKDAEEASEEGYEVTVFTCPQCGGEIISEDITAATFCSFCGASTILDSRISRERRPKYIIPFIKTKEDCRAAYGKMLQRAIFAPKELKDQALIEKFRGIYMPYWVYSFEKKEKIFFPGRKTHRRGDYLITDHYQLDCEVEEDYQGLAYDASSTFSDSLSNAIAPFDLRQRKMFVPAFLSGFYADTSDVEKDVYLSEAEELVFQDASRCLRKDPVCRTYGAGRGGSEDAMENALRPSSGTCELAMLPVWFLSYRNGDRVSYAVVNGQNGKAAADLPVDRKRYVLGSLLLAVPLFILLNLFLTITPGKILVIAAVLAFFCMVISNSQLSHIFARESGEDDKGIASIKPPFQKEEPQWNTRRRRFRIWDSATGKVFLIAILFYITALVPSFFLRFMEGFPGMRGKGSRQTIVIVVNILVFVGISRVFMAMKSSTRGRRRQKKFFGGGHFQEKCRTLGKPFGGILLAVVIWIVNPVSDWFYYIGAFACMGTVLWAIMDIIKQHNLLTTRKLPQLGRRGGDELG
ncbi:MAG: hypothetical protein HFI33_00675 [Lachnospiraceae bacterium]|nr:hypothetical protein [Lachnospiraceae bacterium]